MSRFNTQKENPTLTENFAGGEAFSQTKELELLSILLTSFGNDQYYRSGDETFERLKTLIAKCDPEFVAKCAVYARTKFGMRTITHVVASELAKHASGTEWGKNFYNKIIYRPDDMLEIIACYRNGNAKKMLPNAMLKGFKKAFGKFDSYSLAKYRGENKDIKLVDAVNLIRPVPSERNADALKKLVAGTLSSAEEGNETWEAILTQAGQKAEGKTDKEKAELISKAWTRIVNERILKYFGLLRNLRNILQHAPKVIDAVCEQLTDEKAIKKSLVLPFRFTTAFDEIEKMSQSTETRKVMKALNTAIDISLSNVPVFDGKSLVVLDCSGSMGGRPAQIGSLFSAVLVKTNDCDFMTFSDNAQYKSYNPNDSINTIAKSVRFASGGTSFHSIFKCANKAYDRIIILSDMQGWIGYNTPASSFNEYKRRKNCNPFIYSFDLAGYGSMQFPEKKVFALSGFSEKIFDTMRYLETDKQALIAEVMSIDLEDAPAETKEPVKAKRKTIVAIGKRGVGKKYVSKAKPKRKRNAVRRKGK